MSTNRIDLKNVDNATFEIVHKLRKEFYESTISKTVLRALREFPRLLDEVSKLKKELNEARKENLQMERLLHDVKRAEVLKAEALKKIDL